MAPRSPGAALRIRLAFQNCHRLAAFRLDAGPAVYAEFTSSRSQVLNQRGAWGAVTRQWAPDTGEVPTA